jgi:ATP-dependent helicase/DNAse subunit B
MMKMDVPFVWLVKTTTQVKELQRQLFQSHSRGFLGKRIIMLAELLETLQEALHIEGKVIPPLANRLFFNYLLQNEINLNKVKIPLFGLAKSISGTIQELKEIQAGPEIVAGLLNSEDDLKSRLLLEIYQKYTYLIQAKGLLDQRDLMAGSSQRLQRLTNEEKEELKRIVKEKLGYSMAGLSVFVSGDLRSPLEQEFLSTLAGALNFKLGQEQQEVKKVQIKSEPAFSLTNCQDLNQEINWLFTQLSEKKLEPSQRVLCLIPDIYLYKDALQMSSLRFNLPVSYEYPFFLTDTTLGQSFLKLIKLGAMGWSPETVLNLLTSPYLAEYQHAGIPWVAGRLAALEPAPEVWLAFAERSEAERKYPWTKVKKFIEMINEFLINFPQQAGFCAYLTYLLNEVLPLLTVNSKMKLPLSSLQRDIIVCNKLGELLQELKFSWEALELPDEPISARHFYDQLVFILQETEFREQESTNAQIIVKELNSLTSRENTAWDYLYVLGLAEGIWPRKRSNSWLLTEEHCQSLRTKGYAIKTEEAGAEKWQILKEELYGQAEKVFLSRPQSYRGKSLGPSRFLYDLALMISPHLAVKEGCKDFPQNRLADDKLEIKPKTSYKVTELNRYSYCPALYLYQEYWQLKAPFTIEQQERLLLGQLCHQIIEIVIRDKKALEAAMPEAIEAVQRKNRDCSPWLWIVVEKKAYTSLSRWFNIHQKWLRDKEIANSLVEVSFGLENSLYPALVLERGGQKVTIQGQIDRIDLDRQGRAVIYDYKLNTLPQLESILQGEELQIPIYLLAFARVMPSGSEKLLAGTYYSLKENQAVAISKEKMGAKEWENYLTFIEERVWQVVSGIEKGDFTPRFLQESCYHHCLYRKLCGRR